MAERSHYSADDAYEKENDKSEVSGDINDDSYVTKDRAAIPVQGDSKKVEDPIDPASSNSDAQLERDDTEAIDKSNILKGRTRGAKPQGQGYSEGPDENDLPREVLKGDTGRSRRY